MSKIRTKRNIFALFLIVILAFNLFSASAMAVNIEPETEENIAASVFPSFPVTISGKSVYWNVDPTIWIQYSSWKISATCISGTSTFNVIIDVFYNPGNAYVGYDITQAILYPAAV